MKNKKLFGKIKGQKKFPETNLKRQTKFLDEQTNLVPRSQDSPPQDSLPPPVDKNKVSIKYFADVFVKKMSGKRLDHRMMTVSKFIPISPLDMVEEDSDDENDDTHDKQDNCRKDSCWEGMRSLLSRIPASAFIHLLQNRGHLDVIDPNVYLQGGFEVLSSTMVVCWILTFIFNPETVVDNPLKDRLGYSDVCVGWDSFPANVVACPGMTIGVYLALRFVETNDQRMALLVSIDKLSTRVQWIGKVTSNLFALAAICMPIILMVPPTVSVWGHSLPFIGFIISCALVVFGRFVMFQDELTPVNSVFLLTFCVLSIIFPAMLMCEYHYYDTHGEKSPWPGLVTCIIDYTWFAHLCSISFMLPRDIVLVTTVKLGVRQGGNSL